MTVTVVASLPSTSGASCAFRALALLTAMPSWSKGVVIMKMISNTSMMSAIGVTLMSEVTALPMPLPLLMPIFGSPPLQEIVDQLGG